MGEACPITNKTVDESLARIVAALVAVLIVIGFNGLLLPVSMFLGVDFFIRGFTPMNQSPLKLLAIQINKLVDREPSCVNAGPKILAAKVGFGFAVLIFLTASYEYITLSKTLAVVLAFFAVLEAAYGFCAGCYLHSYLQKFRSSQ